MSTSLSSLIGYSGGGERDPHAFMPLFDHIRPNVIALRDGGLMAVLRLDGVPHHLLSNTGRNGSWARHFALLQLLADRQTEITEHYVSSRFAPPFDYGPHPTPFEQESSERWERRVLGRMRNRHWLISIIVRPQFGSERWFKAMVRKWRGADPVVDNRAMRMLETKVQTAMSALSRFGAVRLGTESRNGFVFSQMGRALRFAISLRDRQIPLMHPEGAFGEAMNAGIDVRHNGNGFTIKHDGASTKATYGRMFGLVNYPAIVRVGMLDELMTADADMVVTNTVQPLTRAQATDKLHLLLDRMGNNRAPTSDEDDDIRAALKELSHGQEVRAHHNWSLAVHADSPEELDERASAVADIVAGSGCQPSPYGIIGGEAAYWAQLPGNFDLRPRPASIGLRRMAMLSSLEGFPQQGEGSHTWGHPVLRLTSPGGTPFDLGLHEEQVPNIFFCGPVGSGKSLFAAKLATSASRLVGPNGLVFVLDKDNSQALMVRANGGSYVNLRRHEDSGIVPLWGLENTSQDRGFAADWVVSLIVSDGGPMPSARVQRQIRKGVAWVMSLPPEERELGAIHAFLPPNEPTNSADRLRPWCAGEPKGWAFDGKRHDLDMKSTRYVGVDITKLLGDDTVLAPMVGYILHAVNKMVTGSRRVIFLVEEGKFVLPKPYLSKPFEDMVLTGRKYGLGFWFVTQQPEHVLDHPLGPSLLSQLKTRMLFRNATASREAYCGGGKYGDGLHCTLQEYKQVTEEMSVGAWKVLIQRPNTFSTVCVFDLSLVPEDIAILSANPRTVGLWDRIAAEQGTHDPAVVKPVFLSRLSEAKL